jgi:hypothetical protein
MTHLGRETNRKKMRNEQKMCDCNKEWIEEMSVMKKIADRKCCVDVQLAKGAWRDVPTGLV